MVSRNIEKEDRTFWESMLRGAGIGLAIAVGLFILLYVLPGGSLFSSEGLRKLFIFVIVGLISGALIIGTLVHFPITRKIFNIILIVAVIVLLGLMLYNLIKGDSASTIFKQSFGGAGVQLGNLWQKSLKPYVSCLWVSEDCVAFQTMDDPNTNKDARELLDLDIEFIDKEVKKDSDLDILVRMRVRHNELGRVEIRPKCLIQEKEGEKLLSIKLEQTSGSNFIFYDKPRVVQFRCQGENPGKDFILKVELEHPSVAVSTWDVWLTKDEEKVGNKGEINAIRNATSSYMINFQSLDQPFMAGEISTKLIFKRHYQEIESQIIDLEFLRIISQGPSTLRIECEGFTGSDIIELNNLKREELLEYKEGDAEKYIFPCTLIVKRPNRELEHNGFLAQALYTVKREYTQKIFIVG